MRSENGFRFARGIVQRADGETATGFSRAGRWLADRESTWRGSPASWTWACGAGEVVQFMRGQIRSERKWISHLSEKPASTAPKKIGHRRQTWISPHHGNGSTAVDSVRIVLARVGGQAEENQTA